MTTAIEVPGTLVAWARRHLEGTGQPLLFEPRHQDETAILVDQFNGEFVLSCEEARTEGTPAGYRVMLALDGMPECFICEGLIIGSFEAVDGHVRVDGPLALTCLSWLLAVKRTGFHLKMLAG